MGNISSNGVPESQDNEIVVSADDALHGLDFFLDKVRSQRLVRGIANFATPLDKVLLSLLTPDDQGIGEAHLVVEGNGKDRQEKGRDNQDFEHFHWVEFLLININ